jgi:uncharacterized protein YndB with AHSA1/START domain
MAEQAAEGAVHAGVSVPVSAERAFERFAEGFGEWYPPEYTWSQAVLEKIAIEPREGGACYELGPHGFRCDWGRVIVWEPPHRLVFTWQVSPRREPVPDPARASEVEVRFEAEESSTRVELEHRLFSRHGEDAAGYRRAMDSEHGWAYMLGRYADSLA